MDSGMISKIQKAKRYADEKDRIVFQSLQVEFTGDNDMHCVSYNRGQWSCGCSFFRQRGVCSHTMAIERILEGMLKPETELAKAESICNG